MKKKFLLFSLSISLFFASISGCARNDGYYDDYGNSEYYYNSEGYADSDYGSETAVPQESYNEQLPLSPIAAALSLASQYENANYDDESVYQRSPIHGYPRARIPHPPFILGVHNQNIPHRGISPQNPPISGHTNVMPRHGIPPRGIDKTIAGQPGIPSAPHRAMSHIPPAANKTFSHSAGIKPPVPYSRQRGIIHSRPSAMPHFSRNARPSRSTNSKTLFRRPSQMNYGFHRFHK